MKEYEIKMTVRGENLDMAEAAAMVSSVFSERKDVQVIGIMVEKETEYEIYPECVSIVFSIPGEKPSALAGVRGLYNEKFRKSVLVKDSRQCFEAVNDVAAGDTDLEAFVFAGDNFIYCGEPNAEKIVKAIGKYFSEGL